MQHHFFVSANVQFVVWRCLVTDAFDVFLVGRDTFTEQQNHILGQHLTTSAIDPYPALGKPRLTFKPDGTFKVTVFSDLHFGENPWDDWGPQQDVNSLALMNTVLEDEKPDYVCVSLANYL